MARTPLPLPTNLVEARRPSPKPSPRPPILGGLCPRTAGCPRLVASALIILASLSASASPYTLAFYLALRPKPAPAPVKPPTVEAQETPDTDPTVSRPRSRQIVNPPRWMVRNEAIPERADPYWQRAKAKIQPILQKGDWKNLPAQARGLGNPYHGWINLTFDDGPHDRWTRDLLALLRKENVKVTFFVVGKMVRKNPDTLRAIHAEGHEIANHTFSHAPLSKLTPEEVLTEYEACNLIIEDIVGIRPTITRPPGGRRTADVYRLGTALGLTTSLWTEDPLDYVSPGADVLYRDMVDGLRPGAVYLLHNNVKQTLEMLPRFIREARRQGYEFKTTAEIYAPEPEATP